jgi:putative membrane protein
MHSWYDWDLAAWFAMGGMMLLVFGALLGLVVWLSFWLRPRDEVPDTVHLAEALLGERFARGEIDAEEYVRGSELLHVHLASRGS